MTGDDLGFTIAFPTPTATRLPKSSNVIPGGTVSARTELATIKTDRSNPSVAATMRQNFRSLAVGSIWHLTPWLCGVTERQHRHVRQQPLVKCLDRKSTRLNSSHVRISYAVFCL